MQYKVKRTDSLSHHGILGMKWGKRNGPPYPLAPGDHSASEKKAGWQKSLGQGDSKINVPGASGGGGGSKEDDEKMLNELYEILEERAKELGVTPAEMLTSQSFALTLAEETGYGDGLTDSDLDRLKRKAFDHYSIEIARPKARERNITSNGKGVKKRERDVNFDGTKRTDSLSHHGILGMKWGKRNGPPYPLSGAAKSLAERRSRTRSDALKKAKKTNINTLSDNELNRINNRLRSEQEFKRLTKQGNKKTKELLFDLGSVAVSGGLLYASVKTGNTYAATVAKATLAASVLETAKDTLSGPAYETIKKANNRLKG